MSVYSDFIKRMTDQTADDTLKWHKSQSDYRTYDARGVSYAMDIKTGSVSFQVDGVLRRLHITHKGVLNTLTLAIEHNVERTTLAVFKELLT